MNNRSQAVRLPADMRFADEVKKVRVRTVGRERVLTPIGHAWDSFFAGEAQVDSDFLSQRPTQLPTPREAL